MLNKWPLIGISVIEGKKVNSYRYTTVLNGEFISDRPQQ